MTLLQENCAFGLFRIVYPMTNSNFNSCRVGAPESIIALGLLIVEKYKTVRVFANVSIPFVVYCNTNHASEFRCSPCCFELVIKI